MNKITEKNDFDLPDRMEDPTAKDSFKRISLVRRNDSDCDIDMKNISE
jgi:hypothetical protein